MREPNRYAAIGRIWRTTIAPPLAAVALILTAYLAAGGW
jgi:hypothetical protein